MKYSVVIISMSDSLEFLIPCIEAVHKTSPLEAEIVLILNAYTLSGFYTVKRKTETMLYAGRIITYLFLRGSPESFAQANNRGILASVGDYVVLLNDDTLVGPGWLESLRSGLELDPSLGCVGPQVADLAIDGSNTFDPETKPYVDYVALCCAMIPRPVFDRVGLLDVQFKPALFEDADFGVRIIQSGYRSAEVEVPGFWHACNGTLGKINEDRRRAMHESNHSRFLMKHGEWLKERCNETA